MSFCLEVVYFLPIIFYYFDFYIILRIRKALSRWIALNIGRSSLFSRIDPIQEWVRCTMCTFPGSCLPAEFDTNG